jgi:hypothetical protein
MNHVPIVLLFNVYLLKQDELLQDFEIRTQRNGDGIKLLMKGNWSDLLKEGQEHPCDTSGQNVPAQETKLSFIL